MKKFFKLLVTSATYRQAAIDDAGEAGEGPAQSPAVARPALPHGRRDDPRLRPGRRAACSCRKLGGPSVKPYQPDGVWEAVAMIGSNTRDYAARHRREPLSPQHVHVLEAGRPAGVDGDLQRPEPRDLRRPPRADQHAAAGAGDAERPAVRRSGAAPGADGDQGRRRRRSSSGSTSSPSDCWRGRSAPRRRPIVQASLTSCWRDYKAQAGGREEADRRRRVEGRTRRSMPATLAAWTMLANRVDESG